MSWSNDFSVYEDEHPLEKSCSKLETLRKHEDFKDLEIQVKNGDPVVAQKIVLAARIPFLHKFVNRRSLRWDLEDIEADCAECIVSYAYTGRLKVTRENVSKVVSFSKTLELDQVVNFCTDFITERLDLDNISLFWTLSRDKDLPTLRKRCLDLMRNQFESFLSKPLFVKLDFEDLKCLISSDELTVSNEESVYEAIKTWIQADSQVDREKVLDELVKCIRWSETSLEFQRILAENDEFFGRSPSFLNYLSTVEDNISNTQDLFNPNSRTQRILTFGEPSSGEKAWIVESFCPVTERSTTLARLTFRVGAAVVSVDGGRVMISGGQVDGKVSSSVELFSCPVKQSRPVVSLNFARQWHGACAVGDAVVVCGGTNENVNPLSSCEVYSRDGWRLLPAMKEPRDGAAVVSTPDRRVFAIGGHNKEGRLSSVEVFRLPNDFATSPFVEGSWRRLAPMREARNGPNAVLFRGNLLVAGGYDIDGEILSSVEMLPIDQGEAQWVCLPSSMNEERGFSSLVVSSWRIFAFGNNMPHYNSVERLTVLRNRRKVATSASNSIIEEVSAAHWESLSPINSMRRVHRAVLLSKY